MIFEYSDYRSFLKSQLVRRVSENSAYSLRAFSRNLGIAPSMLSEVLQAKKNISRELANVIARRLDLSDRETDYFSCLVDYELARSQDLKTRIQLRIEQLNPGAFVEDLDLEVFKAISQWEHIAILETVGLSTPLKNAADVARVLDIPKFKVEEAIARLEQLGLLLPQPDGGWKKSKSHLVAKSNNPNEALRGYHRQMLDKAKESLENQLGSEKFVGSETLPIDSSLQKEAEEAFEECFAKIIALSRRSKKKDAVYHLGIQFFRIAKETEGKS